MSSSGASNLPVAQSAFSQQGTLDWVALTNTSVSFSVGVLNRCSAAGVDPYTVVVGQAIAKNLQLAPVGMENVQNAVANLKSYGGFANVLWFGFGIKSLVRTLGITDEGRSLLAICAALSECYHEDIAAEVMHNIILLHNPPGELTPATSEWLSLIRACSGIFATTKFPVLAEGLMRLDPHVQRLTTYIDNFMTSRNGRGCPSPEDLAAALIGVGKVASKRLESIAITGCAAVGWIAAVAEWLFGLTVFIRDPENNALYSNCLEPSEAQIHILFDTRAPAESTVLELVGRTYHLPDCSELIHQTVPDDSTTTILSGRLRWESCLLSTFGNDFSHLMKIPLNVGIALGCAARIFKAVVLAEPGLDQEAISQCRSYFNAASGQGFVNNVLHWFPELEGVRQHIECGVRMSLLDAKSQYEQKLAAIQLHCSCGICTDWEADVEEERFCSVVLLETILVLCQVLSGMNVAENLFPTRSGFEAFYNRQLLVRRDDTIYENRVQDIGSIVYVFETTSFGSWNIDEHVADRRIVDAARLFIGRDVNVPSWSASALSDGGICVYLDILRELSLDPELVGRVHVVPGKIERDHKLFRTVRDREVPITFLPPLGTDLTKLENASVLLTETARALNISYLLSDKIGKSVHIGPACLVHSVSEARGVVYCKRRGCTSVLPAIQNLPSNLEMESLATLTIDGKTVYLSGGNDYQQAASLVIAENAHPKCYRILADRQCIHCCLQSALLAEEKLVLILYRSLRTVMMELNEG